jgi:hypothetical protein
MIGYGLEGLSNPGPHKLYLVNNTIVNDIQGRGQFVHIASGTDEYAAYNNLFAGFGNLLNGSAGVVESVNNISVSGAAAAGFVNHTAYDYQLTSGSPAVDKGTIPDTTKSNVRIPEYEYVHPAGRRPRNINGVIDVGAFEYQSTVKSEKGLLSPQGFRVTAYPNPFKEKIYFRIESGVSGKGVLQVYNLAGERVGIVYEGLIFANEVQVLEYKPSPLSGNLIYILNINGEQGSGKLLKLE